jgi:hypothetical protein
VSTDEGGTTSIIFCSTVAQVLLNVAGFVNACIVTFPSAAKTLASEFLPFSVDIPTDMGSLVLPAIHSTAILLSNASTVESIGAKSFGALPGATMVGKSAPCTPPSVCPQAITWIICAVLKPTLANWFWKVNSEFCGSGVPIGPAPVASSLPARIGTTGPPQERTAV